jgi:hypothetical protein
MSLRYDLSLVADQIAGAMAQAEQELRLEQAVMGLDTRAEVELQGLLAERLRDHYEVAREVHYPSSAQARQSSRQRCDLVLMHKEVLAGFRQVRSIPITDRIGHRLCTVALWPTIQR